MPAYLPRPRPWIDQARLCFLATVGRVFSNVIRPCQCSIVLTSFGAVSLTTCLYGAACSLNLSGGGKDAQRHPVSPASKAYFESPVSSGEMMIAAKQLVLGRSSTPAGDSAQFRSQFQSRFSVLKPAERY